MRHEIEWVTAPPLWQLAQAEAGGRARFRQPALLRFDTDTFMEEMIALMERGDPTLADRVAKPETWEKPAAGWVLASDASLAEPLRLYQPAHGRFYLAAGALVCRRVGLPPRRVNPAAGERTSMLVRRLVPRANETLDANDPTTFVEQAWVGDRKAGVWKTVSGVVASGEERLPLFPLTTPGEKGRTRQVWAGMLPVASREIYEGALPEALTPSTGPSLPSLPPDPLEDAADPRRATFLARVMEALGALLNSPPQPTPNDLANAAAPYMRESLAFTLLDFADFLNAELNTVWSAMQTPSEAADLAGANLDVYNSLGATFSGSITWRDAILRADAYRPVLLGTGTASGPAPVSSSFTVSSIRMAVNNLLASGVQAAVFAALDPSTAPTSVPPGGAPLVAARATEAGEPEGALYWLRYIYERPLCAPYHDPIVSEPSRPFRLGGFFDPDAPARPLVIRMPFDTSPKGLRRFPKGVAVLMSNKLRQQAERVRNQKLKDLDEGKVGDEPSWGLGMICSLSIPIITICAFLVLMIFLQLLNIVFWWMAFFKICLPIPVRNE